MPPEIAPPSEGRTAFAGRQLIVPLHVPDDLGKWLPSDLEPVERNLAYLECFRLKRRIIGSDGLLQRPARVELGQYQQICVTLLVRAGGERQQAVRKYHLLMWEDLDIGLLTERGLGWPVRAADIEQTALVESEDDWDYPGSDHRYDVQAWRRRSLLLQLSTRLDQPPAPPAAAAVTSFCSAFEDGTSVRVYAFDLLDHFVRARASGAAQLFIDVRTAVEELSTLDREVLLALGAATPAGGTLCDVAWSRVGHDVRLETTNLRSR